MPITENSPTPGDVVRALDGVIALVEGLIPIFPKSRRAPWVASVLLLRRHKLELACQDVFGDSMCDPDADKLLAAVLESEGGLSWTEMSNLFSRHKAAPELKRLAEVVLKTGLVDVVVVPTRGRSQRRLVPRRAEEAEAHDRP